MSSAVETRFACLTEALGSHLGVLAKIVEARTEVLPENLDNWIHVTPVHIQAGWIPFMNVVELLQRRLGLMRMQPEQIQKVAQDIWRTLRQNLENTTVFPGMVQGVFFLAEPGQGRQPGKVTIHYFCDQPI